MNRDRTIIRLAWFLGVVVILMGLAELVVRIVDYDGLVPIAFWVVTLCGGGTLILVGTFVVTDRRWRSFALVALGCLLAAVGSAWTVLLPLLAITLLVLSLQRTRQAARPAAR
ncbi:MAG TPA: hypothetical protein VNA28_09525 [Solirubrobacteraceae bacterium]|nr:hypothetical protein [Solirubrobacteraceae bacterium]